MADGAIAICYLLIPALLVLGLIDWKRGLMPANQVVIGVTMFGLFIVSCGWVHWEAQKTFSVPAYRWLTFVKCTCASVSVLTLVWMAVAAWLGLMRAGAHVSTPEETHY
mgnify:CR=1 FL=1|tara:strand:+ start:1683 stop:2009 length:327 start_codon:yes stop_codon:yes gene_type:complete